MRKPANNLVSIIINKGIFLIVIEWLLNHLLLVFIVRILQRFNILFLGNIFEHE